MRVLIYFALAITPIVAQSSVTLSASRIIYGSGDKEVFYTLKNETNSPYLIQSWIASSDGSKPPFITTPPLFKIEQGSTSNIRVIYTGKKKLPQDRESLFYLNILNIPAKNKSINNKVSLNTKSVIKMMYRPSWLNSSDAKVAFRELSLTKNKTGLKIYNPTSFYINLTKLMINGEDISPVVVSQNSAIAPFTNTYFKYQKPIRNVSFLALSDRGIPMESGNINL